MAETRNTPVLKLAVQALAYSLPVQQIVLNRLEEYFQNDYLAITANVDSIAKAAGELRLEISIEECTRVLDHIAKKSPSNVTINQVEEAIYDLFGNRFIEP